VLGWLLGAVAVLTLPRLVRLGIRRLRLSRTEPGAAAEAAWAEAKSMLADSGVWLAADSPRRQAEHAAELLAPPAAEGLTALAVAVERARFDRAPAPADNLKPSLSLLAEGLTGRRRHLLDQWWPRSLRPHRRGGPTMSSAPKRSLS